MKITLSRYSLFYKAGFTIKFSDKQEWSSTELWYSDSIKIRSADRRERASISWSIVSNLFRFKQKYIINTEQKTFFFRKTAILHSEWELSSTEIGKYQILEHEDLNFSIFKNNTQVAKAAKNHDSFFRGDVYEISHNRDENQLLLAIILILIGKTKYDSLTNLFYLGDFGSKTKEDKYWMPK